MQFMTFLAAQPRHRGDFSAWCLHDFAPRILQQPGVESLTLNLASPPPAGLQLYGGSERARAGEFDAVLEIGCSSAETYSPVHAIVQSEVSEHLALEYTYRVDTKVVVDRPERLTGNPAPGLKLLRGLFFYADMPDSAVKRSWLRHENLATKVHIGLARYKRHWIDEVITKGAPAIRGVSDLHFASEEDMLQRYFDSDRGREEILHDIGHFIEDGMARVFTKEHVLR